MDFPQTPALEAAEQFAVNFIQNEVGAEYVFHDINHTQEVVASAYEIAQGYDLTDREVELILIAAWYHDVGYVDGGEGHEERGCKMVSEFLKKNNFSKEEIETACGCIMATKIPQEPKNQFEEILADADMAHLGRKSYWERTGRLRQEFLMTRGMMMSEPEWIDFEITFMTNHRYHTEFASELYDKRKHKHIRQLIKQKLRLNPKEFDSMEALAKSDLERQKKEDKFKKKMAKNLPELELKELRLGRGVETMYRTTYRTHVSLSAIADNKANIMLSINAIIISIVLPQLVPQFATNPRLIVPTMILLTVCLIAMFYATLSTRPKVTEGKVTIDDIKARKGNLLFFGNFYKMSLKDYDWGVKEMIKDNDYLYGTMTRDLYFLGIVLAKKYRYLSICYQVFMYGLIVSVIAFAISFLLL